jgi:hypothetical protein
MRKSALDFSVQDASAALPQNCQTTRWILRTFSFGVNVTLVMELLSAKSLRSGNTTDLAVATTLLFLPGLTVVGGDPDFGSGG